MGAPSEEDVGIIEYVSPVPGFRGILKHRFRDFLVREVDLKGQVARLTTLEPDDKADDESTVPAAREVGFSPEQLAATRAHVVASFSLVAGGENGALLDDLLRRVVEMYGMKEDLQGEGKGPGAAMAESGSGGINETAADVAAEPSPPDGAAQKPSATGDTAGEVASTAGGSGTAADDGDGGGGASCGDGDGGKDAGMGDGSMRRKLERVSVLLRPIGSKEVRKAVHEFFRTTPGLPPMRTEAIVTQQQQQQQQSEPMELGPDAAAQQQQGSKRGPPGGTEDSQPAKWQKDSGRGGRGGGRGGRGRGGEAKQSQSGDRPQTQATATTCIEVAFDPCDLEEGGAGAGADSSHGGRGSGGRGRGRGGRRRGGGWEGGKHNFVRFVLYKENMDTQVALTILSRHLAIAAGGHNFGFAGTKDKRGVTCQFATAFKVSPSRLSTVNSHLRGIRVGNFSFCDEGLRLGCLSGNEFHLLMRDVRLASPEPPAVAAAAATTTAITADGEEAGPKGTSGTKIDSDVVAQVTAACETVARNGFINYFGLQRFGTGGAATQEVGKALLRGEYEKAARLVLTGRADERSDYADARRLFFDNGDAKGALRRLPHFMLGERAVLSVLATDPADWAGAMKAVPRTMRMMYLHAWQSYVWNSAASHRIRTYGRDGVVAGDLVLPRSSATAAGGEGLMLLGGVDDSGEGMEPEDESEGSAGTVTRRLALARLATEADVEAGRYNIFDVVLPLPGTEAQYPTHSTGAWIRKCRPPLRRVWTWTTPSPLRPPIASCPSPP
ncbi:hypothetical protein Vretifemale_10170 [Volvox reticuliferus]|uniref:TRUD domain-containing protein n=1 Tax=Volvox reticuliferus TaxID=1737510 RepID=A0A8J4CEQ6_9CHLO|nr:hypothetical protein Vretifemale_10170 [Volvox reticuliferus]